MKTPSQTLSIIALVTIGVVASSAALADPRWVNEHSDRHQKRHGYYERDARDVEYARVVDVDPIIRRVRVSSPQRECWNEERPVSSGPSRTEIRSTLLGGLIGAAVGHHLHDPVAVLGGSMIGAAIGSDIGANRATRRGEYREVGYESVQRCAVNYRDEWAEQIEGYRVTYVYEGREYTTRLSYDPGSRLQVGVDVRPESDDYGQRY